jgi:hypothetical protein
LKTDVNVSTERKKQNKLEKKIFLVGILEVTDEKRQIRIRKTSVRIQGSGSIPYQNMTDHTHWLQWIWNTASGYLLYALTGRRGGGMSPLDGRALAAGLQRIQDTLQGHKATLDSLLAG